MCIYHFFQIQITWSITQKLIFHCTFWWFFNYFFSVLTVSLWSSELDHSVCITGTIVATEARSFLLINPRHFCLFSPPAFHQQPQSSRDRPAHFNSITQNRPVHQPHPASLLWSNQYRQSSITPRTTRELRTTQLPNTTWTFFRLRPRLHAPASCYSTSPPKTPQAQLLAWRLSATKLPPSAVGCRWSKTKRTCHTASTSMFRIFF